ncbi:MAG: hypothetical protein R3B97_11730 [Dehalococcoidia bacterium]|nr:hypothetical protein [Dehalococcoidia bacterium]MCB9484617.1 hypothetical protein [Thermoflexaceae bacterium]
MSPLLHFNRQRLLAATGGVVVAGALFGAGFVTASASGGGNDSDGNAANGDGVKRGATGIVTTGTSGSVAPAPQPGRSIPAAFGAEDSVDRGGASFSIVPQPLCQGDLPPILAGSAIDLSKAGFALTPLGEGYSLRSISVRSESECDESGAPVGEPAVVVDTAWVHRTTGIEAYVSQRTAAEPVANLHTPYNGQVWADGYSYAVWVNAYPVIPLDGPAIESAGRPAAEPDPRGAEVLREVLTRLAPSVAERCYYEQAQGSWDDLGSLGVGDPRPAVPAGLEEQYSEFVVFTAPPADCNAAKLDGVGSFSASWGDRSGMSVSVSAYPAGNGPVPGLGYLDDGSASWMAGGLSFSVWGYGPNGPIGKDAIRAIASAMDSNFSAACFVTTRNLTPGELAVLGFKAPAAPDGFEVTSANLQATEAPGAGDCAGLSDADYYPQYNLNWTLEGKDGMVIEATASRHPKAGDQSPGFIFDGGINWMASDGTFYAVYSYSKEGVAPVSRDTLIAVARSMDPALDPSTLQEGGGIASVDKPLPAGSASGR